MSWNQSSGNDFSNNLFTDLTPLLALFGETVTKQYLSIAVGWEDWVMLGIGPVGIITMLVSAIRVSGHRQLKALIGR